MSVLALEFPEISELLVWPDILPSFNKIAIISMLAVIITAVFFWMAGRRDSMVSHTWVRNLAKASNEFVWDSIVN